MPIMWPSSRHVVSEVWAFPVDFRWFAVAQSLYKVFSHEQCLHYTPRCFLRFQTEIKSTTSLSLEITISGILYGYEA